MERIGCLWTGGLDSTYTIAYFSKFEVEIQPYYLLDKNRNSQKYELKAIEEISDIFRNDKHVKAKIMPLITKNVDNIAPDDEIKKSFKKLRKQMPLGSQYEWLARFAKEIGSDSLYVSIEKSDHSIGRKCVYDNGDVIHYFENEYEYFSIDKDKSTQDCINVFGRFRFPMSWDRTKKEEVQELVDMGYEDVLKKVWFCFDPVVRNGNVEKCGICNPCRTYIKAGFRNLFSEEALQRYEKIEKTPHWVHQLRDYKNLALIKLGLK
ncbi:MAG: hypothetical protein K6F39_06465 [Lachnospiraceae bacterium]|nr:hypothetical protein [Lachnospiraceae bacterium]